MTEQNTQPEELDLRSYLRPLLRRKWIILAIVILAAAGTYFLSSRQPKQYSASTKLYVEVADPTLNITSATVSGNPVNASVTPNVQAIADVAQLITSQSITTSVRNMLGRPVYTAGTVTSTPVSGTSFVSVSATSHSPVLAAKLANDYVAAFLKSRQQAVASTARKDLRAAKRTLNALTAAGNAATSGKNNTAAANNQSSTEVTQKLVLQQQISAYQQIALNPSPGAQQVDVAADPSVRVHRLRSATRSSGPWSGSCSEWSWPSASISSTAAWSMSRPSSRSSDDRFWLSCRTSETRRRSRTAPD